MKKALASKTIKFGLLQIVFGLVGMVAGFIDSGTGMALVITGFSSLGFRAVTSEPISFK